MNGSCVLVVETTPDNVKVNPRSLGLCAGVNQQGMIYVRCNGIVTDQKHAVTSGIVGLWVVEMAKVKWTLLHDKLIDNSEYDMNIEKTMPVDSHGRATIIVLRSRKVLNNAMKRIRLKRKSCNDDLYICCAPFGNESFCSCLIPVEGCNSQNNNGIITLDNRQLCEGIDGAPIVCSKDCSSCGILLSARTREAWCPNLTTPFSRLVEPMMTTNMTIKGIVGLTANQSWASGVMIPGKYENSVSVLTCAHVVRNCKLIRVWQHGHHVGDATAVFSSDKEDIDVVVLQVFLNKGHQVDCLVLSNQIDKTIGPVLSIGFHSHPPVRPYSTEPEIKPGILIRCNGMVQISTCHSESGSSGGAIVDKSTGFIIGIQFKTVQGFFGSFLSLSYDIDEVLKLIDIHHKAPHPLI